MQQNDLNTIEQCFLGCLLVSDRAYDEHAPRIRQEYFYTPVHARIFDVIREKRETGKPVSVALLAPLFAADPDLSDAGGSEYIRGLADSVCTSRLSTVNGYAEKIHDEHCRRTAKAYAVQVAELAKKVDFSAKEDWPQIETWAFNIAAGLSEDGEDASAKPDLSDCVNIALVDIEKAQMGEFGLRTGLGRLDSHLRGLKPGRLYVAAGRPAMGKTAFGVTVATNAAQAGKRVLFFSIEMGQSDLTQRIIARFSGVPVDAMNTPHFLDDGQRAAIAQAKRKDQSPTLVHRPQAGFDRRIRPEPCATA